MALGCTVRSGTTLTDVERRERTIRPSGSGVACFRMPSAVLLNDTPRLLGCSQSTGYRPRVSHRELLGLIEVAVVDVVEVDMVVVLRSIPQQSVLLFPLLPALELPLRGFGVVSKTHVHSTHSIVGHHVSALVTCSNRPRLPYR